MKTSRKLFTSALIGLSLCCGTAMADIIAKETFAYPEGTKLAGANEGTGTWAGAWTVNDLIPSATITTKGLTFGDGTANPSASPSTRLKAARRAFNKFSGDSIYVKFTFSVGAGTTTDPDRFGFFLPNDEHGGLMMGSGLNGSGSEIPSNAISARTFDNSKHRIAAKTPLVPDTTYTLVAEWSKSVSGANAPYNRLRFWVDPKADELATAPYKEMTYKELRPAINMVGFYIADTEPGDVFNVRNIVLASTWEEVLAQP